MNFSCMHHRIFSCLFVVLFVYQLSYAHERWLVVLDTTNTSLRVAEQELEKDIPAFTAGIKYAIWNMNANPRQAIETEFRRILMSCGKQTTSAEQIVRGQDGQPLSALLVRWLTGHITPQAVASQVSMHADHEIFRTIAQSIVDPQMIAKHTYAVSEAARFIAQCTQLLGEGSVCIAGNWDRLSFPLLRQRQATHPIFAHIPVQLQFISGLTRYALPCDAHGLFGHIAAQTQVPLDHIIFVSAVHYHVNAAQKVGVRAIHVHHHRFDEAYRTLMQLTRAG